MDRASGQDGRLIHNFRTGLLGMYLAHVKPPFDKLCTTRVLEMPKRPQFGNLVPGRSFGKW